MNLNFISMQFTNLKMLTTQQLFFIVPSYNQSFTFFWVPRIKHSGVRIFLNSWFLSYQIFQDGVFNDSFIHGIIAVTLQCGYYIAYAYSVTCSSFLQKPTRNLEVTRIRHVGHSGLTFPPLPFGSVCNATPVWKPCKKRKTMTYKKLLKIHFSLSTDKVDRDT